MTSQQTQTTTTATTVAVPTLPSLWQVSEGALWHHMAGFMSARDILQGLALACRESARAVNSRQGNELFETLLKRDFLEGKVLMDAIRRRQDIYGIDSNDDNDYDDNDGSDDNHQNPPSYKKLYMAFQQRWKMPSSSRDTPDPICVHWRNPWQNRIMNDCQDDAWKKNQLATMSADARSLVFLVRIGADTNNPDTCGVLWWAPTKPENPWNDQLEVDYVWFDGDQYLDVPHVPHQICQWIDEFHANDNENARNRYADIAKFVKEAYCLTVHVVDLELGQVLTLMEEEPLEDVQFGDTIEGFCCSPNIYGLAPPGSPYYRPLTSIGRHNDRTYDWLEEEGVEVCQILGALRLDRLYEHLRSTEENPVDDSAFLDGDSGVTMASFCDTTVTRRDEVCSLLRAVMKAKCRAGAGVIWSFDSSVVPQPLTVNHQEQQQQPTWVTSNKILDTIVSFASFEQQAGSLRLVCRHFKDSAMRQLEKKLLDETKVIAFQRGCDGWFKAQVRRGWSSEDGDNADYFAVTEDSVLDESLYMASCRCCPFGGHDQSCPGKHDCPGTKQPVTFGKQKTILDMEQARTLLKERGYIKLSSDFPGGQGGSLKPYHKQIKYSFEEKELSVFCICQKIFRVIKKQVEYEIPPESFKRFYGMADDPNPRYMWTSMTMQFFVRSLFLVFSHKAYFGHAEQNERVSKVARQAPPSIGMAKSLVGQRFRMKMVARFYNATGEPVEVRLEGKSNYDW